jgi:hypothetical protein
MENLTGRRYLRLGLFDYGKSLLIRDLVAGAIRRGSGSAGADCLRRIRNARRACGLSKEIGRESYREGNGDRDKHEFEDGAAAVGVHREGGFDPGAW